MDTILVPGYPKLGNTLLVGTTLNLAGSVKTDFDIYALKSQNMRPDFNKLFETPLCTIKTHQMKRHIPSWMICILEKSLNLSPSQEIHSTLS